MQLMPLVLPEFTSPIRIDLERSLTDDELLRLCEQNEVFHIEREPDGQLLARKIGGTLAGGIASTLSSYLWEWAEADGRGKVFLDTGFILKDGSMRGARLVWVSLAKLDALTKEEFDGFPPVCPEFVIEILSWNYTLPELQEKMRTWIANGVELGWLVDPDREVVEVYRQGREVEVVEGGSVVEGDGPVAGFALELKRIWS